MRLRHPLTSIATLLALATALAACSPIGALNALAPSGTHRDTLDVAYGAGDRQKLDVYQPTTPAPAGGFPVVLFFYGGSWNQGQRGDYRFVGESLAARGIVTLIADYRLYPEVRYPDFLDDCADALAYTLREAGHYGGNPKRVFVAGHSAGAYNAAMLALDGRWLARTGHAPAELAGWVGLAGPYDFYPIGDPDVKPVFDFPNYPPNSQPIDFASATVPRTFLGAARNDKLVDPVRNTGHLAEALKGAGAPISLKLYDHVNHLTLAGAFARPLRFLAPVRDDVAQFINDSPPVP